MGRKRNPPAPAFDVHVFLATAEARDSIASGCGKGELHGLLIFCRQPEGEPSDERLARKSASAAGWKSVRIERAKRLPVTAVPQDEVLRSAFREALRDGSSVVAHRRQEGRNRVQAAA